MTAVAVGTEIAGLRIDEAAAHGGSSIVYRATEIATGKQCAVKVLQNADPAATARLRREAALLATVQHPGIVPFQDLHELGDDLLLVTDWIEGESLRDRLRREKSIRPREVRYLLTRLADPLDYLHDHGIVHRDISPGNIIQRPDGSLVLVDLGIGHNSGSATMTNHDLIAGTPKYLAPEIIHGESATPRSDQYSTAVLIHELATGSSPFPHSNGIAAALHHQVNTAPVPLTEIDPTISVALSDAVLRALSKKPADRFATVGAFAQAAVTAQPDDIATPSRGPKLLVGALLIAALVLLAVLIRPARSGDTAGEVANDGQQPVEPVEDEVRGLTQPAEASNADAADVVETAPTGDDTVPADELVPDLSAPAVATAWSEGFAATLPCNQLLGSTFSDGVVPVDYFGDPPGRERVIDGSGFDQSWALEVGRENDFGQYAEIIPIIAGQEYWFRGWFTIDGQVADAQMGITLVNAAYEGTGVTVSRPVLENGFAEVRLADVPEDAAFALPYLFKDASPGVLIADELVFGVATSCFSDITAGNG